MEFLSSLTENRRVAAKLAANTSAVSVRAAELFERANLPPSFSERFMEIYATLCESWASEDSYQSGWHAGMASASFLRSVDIPFYSVIREIEELRSSLFFSVVPQLLDASERPQYFERLGRFITGYGRGMSASASIQEYREIGETARRLTVAESPDHLEREAVAGVFRILEVDYAWYTHRQDGIWNISHATAELSPAVREGRMRDADVDGIDRLLKGAALVYEDTAHCGSSMQAVAQMLKLGSALSVPVMNRDVCIGTVGIGRRAPSVFNEHDLAVVRLIASQTAAARNEKQAAVDMRATLRALRESEMKLRVLSEAIPQIVWTADTDGSIDWYNHQWYEHTGQTPDEARGWGWQSVHHPEDLPAVMEAWPRSIRNGERFEMEFRLRGRDGEFRWFLTRVDPLHNERGEIIKWYGTNTDIHEQREALHRKDEIAKTLQQVFIPQAFPISKRVSFDAVYMPAENDAQVGGDWYDAFALPDGTLVFSIGDVAGHGLEAAVTMGKIRQLIFGAALDSPDPAEVLAKVNRVMLLQDAPMATAIVGFIDAQTNVVRYACAGHAPPVVATKDGQRLMPCGGLALGIQEDIGLVVQTFESTPEMLVVLYTDGITESERKILDGEERLVEAVRIVVESASQTPALRIAALTLEERMQNDDVAVLAIRFIDERTAGGVSSIQSRPHGMAWDFDSSDGDAAQRARRQVVEFVRRQASGEPDLFAVEAILGELIANTVDHAPGPVHIDIDWTGQAPILSVHDQGIAFTHDRTQAPDPMSESGRGLFIIHALGNSVNVVRDGSGGKSLQVKLPVRRSIA